MKYELMIDPNCEEKIVIYAKEKNAVVDEIIKIAERNGNGLFGYDGSEIIKIDPCDIHYVSVIKNKIFAVCGDQKYLLKERLYVLEELLPEYFVRINQSCLANIGKMERFDTSISGTLKIRFKNGDVDYVSRRQLRKVKERIGI
ncbi:MAG: LytTR family transcriptional regulator DNA-binding domain-containing protein [Clostridia bacterium]|nr:LytTR family transcriptional regulator DNA-binding domain-containing protein [Clostridia bacterium]